jgi:hypothetical protein
LNQWRETLKFTYFLAKTLLISKINSRIFLDILENLLLHKTNQFFVFHTVICSEFWQERASNLDATPHLSIILAERQYIRTPKPLYPKLAFQTVQSVGER